MSFISRNMSCNRLSEILELQNGLFKSRKWRFLSYETPDLERVYAI